MGEDDGCLAGGGDISRFKVTSENSYQGIEFPWRSPSIRLREGGPPSSPRPPLFARPITKIYFRLFREERAKPTNPFSILSTRFCPRSCVSRRHVHRTPSSPPPPSIFTTTTHPTRVSSSISQAFLLFIPLGERTLEILVSDNRDRILFAIIGGDEPRLPYRVPSTAKFPWKSSLETPRELYLYLFDEVDIPSSALLSRVYIHL